ncbi:MAG: PSD1 and planctomycete cytochrome C domain-containing protein, partial [Chloroflexi bacterium]|nr:PSD1 and planctomycete cytochrome C domain-containing protein [Chloroflexota bacterium]
MIPTRFKTNAGPRSQAESTRRAPLGRQASCCAAGVILLSQIALGSPNAFAAATLPAQPRSGSTGSLSAGSAPVSAAYFDRFVRPVLERSCLGCHGVGAKIDGLDLSSRESALRGGTRGPALVPGSASKSRLFEMVTGVRSPQMPPTGKLPVRDIKILQRWLNGGAPWTGPAILTARKQVWWAFRLPTAAVVPVFHDTNWAKNPVDAFVLARLRSHGLTPSPAAPRSVLIRRAFLDMLGILPTPYEVDAFERDRSPGAWAKVVDRLLASPRYGERWGRHWLDLVRYADSGGFEGDRDRPYAWRYRDYVIDSFNRDTPYDTFLKEQIAGDELCPDDPEALIATGYLACGPQDIVMQNAKNRADELDDLVATTGSAFLGLTTGCARCHDHKYDPIKQTDYYRLSAVFAPSERREVDIPTPEERHAAGLVNVGLDREAAPLKESLRPLEARGRMAAVAAGHAAPTAAEIAAALPPAGREELTRLTNAIAAIDARRPVFPRTEIVTDGGPTFPPVHLLIRGDALHPGPVVQPGFIAALPGGDLDLRPDTAAKTREKTTTGRRLALANWIASASNPLTARVWMN